MFTFVRDHLGSVRAVVDLDGQAVCEESDYYTYGGKIPGCSATPLFDSRWGYSGKEGQSTIAGLPYLDYGARLYDTRTCRWLSPDPLAEKYRSLSPNAYCAGDPVNFVDPDGELITTVYDGKIWKWQIVNGIGQFVEDNNQGNPAIYQTSSNQYMDDLTNALLELMKGENGLSMITSLTESECRIHIGKTEKMTRNTYGQEGKSVIWDSNLVSSIPTLNGCENSVPYISLGHELAHAYNDINGNYNSKTWLLYIDSNKSDIIKKDEIFAVHYENLLRKEHGLPLRSYYDSEGMYLPVLDSNGRAMYVDKSGIVKYKLQKKDNRYVY